METEFRRKSLAADRIKAKSRSRLVFVFFLLLMGAGGFFFYTGMAKSFFSPLYSQMTAWINQHKNHLQKDLAKKSEKVKPKMADRQEAEPQIHFEFYNSLPNMQVRAAVPQDNTQAPKTTLAAKTPPVEAPATPTSVSFANADELEKEVSRHIKQVAYFVQLGLFRDKAAADQYRETLSSVGFQANIAKIIIDNKKFFRVQLGPYTSKNQAKLAQQQLQKRGMSSMVHADVEG